MEHIGKGEMWIYREWLVEKVNGFVDLKQELCRKCTDRFIRESLKVAEADRYVDVCFFYPKDVILKLYVQGWAGGLK